MLNSFSLGIDIGYAIGISDDNEGGFYYAPRTEYMISEKFAAVASYRGLVIDFANSDIVALGVQLAL